MKEAIGSIPLYNFIIIFIVITFGFLSATLMYYKAFKLNSKIAYSLEKYEGYNDLSSKEINKNLGTLGYRVGSTNDCPAKQGNRVGTSGINYPICIYEITRKDSAYFNYGIITYIYLDIPLIGGTFKIPVYTESEKIFKFSS